MLQRMSLRHDHRMPPLVAGEGRQIIIAFQSFGGDADIGFTGGQHFADLARAALQQRQVHLGVILLEPLDHLGQGVTRLGVRGRHHEMAGFPAGKLVGNTAQVLGVEQNAFNHPGQFLTGARQAKQALATTLENLHPQFVLKILDVLGHPRLRGK